MAGNSSRTDWRRVSGQIALSASYAQALTRKPGRGRRPPGTRRAGSHPLRPVTLSGRPSARAFPVSGLSPEFATRRRTASRSGRDRP